MLIEMHEKLTVSLYKYQKKLEETECSLFDLEEKYRQANATIKEKEFVISNLLKSGTWYSLLVFSWGIV